MNNFEWDNFRTYHVDLPLMGELGLKPFCGKVWDTVFVGKVILDDALVFVWVQGAPAQFWRFEIVDFGNCTTHCVETGSGALRDHWPCIKRIAEGMLVVNSVSYTPKNENPFEEAD